MMLLNFWYKKCNLFKEYFPCEFPYYSMIIVPKNMQNNINEWYERKKNIS